MIGSRVARVEDPGLLTGTDPYVGDLSFPDEVSLLVVRSPVAHAHIEDLELEEARAHGAGVLAVWSAADLIEDLGSVPVIPPRLSGDTSADSWLQPVLAHGKVRYVGEPVAVVIATDRYTAEDAAELIWPSFDELAPSLNFSEATPPPLFEKGNEVKHLEGRFGDPGDAFANAPIVVKETLRVGRHTAMPMETRGLLARIDESGRLEVYGATKVPHWNRETLASLLGIDPEQISMRETSVGGSFGVRGEFYPEDFLVPWAARKLRRPVKWNEDRREHLLATNHAREQMHQAALAGDEEGNILAIRSEFWTDLGAYVRTNGLRVPEVTVITLPGPYDIANYDVVAHCVVTNRTPTGTYRAPGRVESCFVRETLIDRYAERLNLDPLEVRRRNLVRADQMPYRRMITPSGRPVVLEDSDYPAVLEQVVARLDLTGIAERRRKGEKVGVGIAPFLERSTIAPFEAGSVTIAADGRVYIRSGGTSVGQGVRTVLAQIAAEELDVDISDVTVETLNTDETPRGVGSFGSRTTIAAGSAVQLAARATAAQARKLAASELEVAEEDLVLKAGGFEVGGAPARRAQLGRLAEIAEASGDRLGSDREFEIDAVTYDFGVHAAVAVVDVETGGARVESLVLGFDAGRSVNPMLVEGQLHGGALQGLGGALLEHLRYDDDGNPTTTSFMDYLLPTAQEAPRLETVVVEGHLSSSNPLGVKGVGEGGITGVPAAIALAVGSALGRPGCIASLPIDVRDLLAVP